MNLSQSASLWGWHRGSRVGQPMNDCLFNMPPTELSQEGQHNPCNAPQ